MLCGNGLHSIFFGCFEDVLALERLSQHVQ
jgi:hypothetical protein